MATPSHARGCRLPAAALLLAALAAGCHARSCVNPPEDLLGRFWQNARQPTPDTYPDPAQTTAAGLDAAFGNNPNPTPPPVQTETRPLEVLSLSGGGKYAAYSAGVLNGWTAAGTRPRFDVVTGISSGALLAVFAFLGPEYDARAADLFVNVDRRDLFRLRPLTGPFTRQALATTRPLARMIDEELNDGVVAEIARAHCAGRRLFVATGNRTTLRPAIWDVGAIAASGRPDAGDLARKVLLASASHPGFAPAVELDVVVNGVHYRELHGDGGNLIQTFVRTANGLGPGSNVYVVSAGPLYREPLTERPGVVSTVGAAASNTLYALFRADVANLYALCAVTRSRFHLIATPPGVRVAAGSLRFDRENLQQLYDAGYRQGVTGIDWRTTPPGSQPGETLGARTGLEFVVPEVCPPAAPAGPRPAVSPPPPGG